MELNKKGEGILLEGEKKRGKDLFFTVILQKASRRIQGTH